MFQRGYRLDIYPQVERHINFATDGQTAWLDEIIVSEKWGWLRGTGEATKQHMENLTLLHECISST